MNAQDIMGIWSCVANELVAKDGSVSHPHGAVRPGRLMYGPGGELFVVSTRVNRRKLADSASGRGAAGATAEEKAAAAEGCVAYYGRYEVKGDTIYHNIEISLLPDWEGTSQPRRAVLERNRLTLTTPPDASGTFGRILWERESR